MSKKSSRAKGRKLASLEVIVRITDDDGNIVEKTIKAPTGFASTDDFVPETREGFLRDFAAMENAGLEASEAIPEAISEYKELVSRKEEEKGEE